MEFCRYSSFIIDELFPSYFVAQNLKEFYSVVGISPQIMRMYFSYFTTKISNLS